MFSGRMIDEMAVIADSMEHRGNWDRGADDIKADNMETDWLSMCQIASKPTEKEDIIFESLEDSKLAENHIIICGMVENIRYFVMPLRAKHLNHTSPIVIVHDELPTSK